MNQGKKHLKGVKVLFLDPDDPRGVELSTEIIQDEGGEVTIARSVDDAVALIRERDRSFTLIIYGMWMPTGEIFKNDIDARNGDLTGKRFATWVRSPTGGNVPAEVTPLLLYTGWPKLWLEEYNAEPKGKRDRTLLKGDASPEAFIAILCAMTRA